MNTSLRFHKGRLSGETDKFFEALPDASDIFYPTELICPNCDQISSDLICSCGATIQHPDSGDTSCN